MGAMKLYGVGHVSKATGVSQMQLLAWERKGWLDVRGKPGQDKRRFTPQAFEQAKRLAGLIATTKKPLNPVIPPGALAVAEKRREVSMSEAERSAQQGEQKSHPGGNRSGKRRPYTYFVNEFRKERSKHADDGPAIEAVAKASGNSAAYLRNLLLQHSVIKPQSRRLLPTTGRRGNGAVDVAARPPIGEAPVAKAPRVSQSSSAGRNRTLAEIGAIQEIFRLYERLSDDGKGMVKRGL